MAWKFFFLFKKVLTKGGSKRYTIMLIDLIKMATILCGSLKNVNMP